MSFLASRHSDHSSRKHRHRDTRRKLSGLLFDALTQVEDVAVVGSDPLLVHFALGAGIEPGAIATCQALIENRPVTLVGVPSRLWYSRDAMQRLQRVKASMEDCGRPCILLPQGAVTVLGEGNGSLGNRARLLIELILHPEAMGLDEDCAPRGCDPIGCRAAELLSSVDCPA